ncbi:ATP-binding cassette domain-containing protein [Salinicola sp. JS01]|uniref:ATP-binding cassette domain-containing protein n=1 Tax=Salinicola sp. JS01 TaxID=3050071 RepID=UPI00255B74C6|nr:ATP-binding cassette domain-containing protein [Salinicola sp. JS01]WIX34346.1 ATP-binding cassette domain-containing protein [Salinicola sp. JS01]
MALLRLEQLQLAYGHHSLLDGADLVIEKGERLALVGRNGTGKSTLLRLIAGDNQADDGQVWRAPGLKIGVLEQALPDADQATIFEVVAQGLPETGALLTEYHQLVAQAEPDMRRLETLQTRLEALDGWSFHQRIDTVLTRLGLPAATLMSDLSGGWRRRVALARAMVAGPDLLLLDEPTNHLDIDTIAWLETQLLAFEGAVLFITHDRAFLSRLATAILELDRGRLGRYPGDYATYQAQKAHELEVEARERAEFDKKLAQEESWIRQGIKARRTRNEGRVRALEKMRDERAQRRERTGKASFQVDSGERSGKRVVELKGVTHGYAEARGGDGIVIRDLSLEIQRGDRIGLIGRNGAGKTTLLKILLGELTPSAGEVRLGTNLSVAYFDQLRAGLELDKSVYDNVAQGSDKVSVGGKDKHVISYLQDFLFTPERARQPVRALSGGESNRLLLAKLFTQPANVLVLDEPTNDLDVETLELLEELLLDFDGTLLLVSHDRAFMDNVVTGVLAFEGDGVVREYVGGYSDWVRQGGKLPPAPWEQPAAPVDAEAGKARDAAQGESQPAAPAAPEKRRQKLSYKLQRELDALPATIEALETRVAEFETRMSDPTFYQQESSQVTATLEALAQTQAELDAAMERWMALEAMAEGES